MELKGCKSIIQNHDSDLCAAMLKWVHVRDSDWDDLRRRRVVDIFNYHLGTKE